MAGVIQRVEWEQSAAELYARYRVERDVEARKRLQALWWVRCGEYRISEDEVERLLAARGPKRVLGRPKDRTGSHP